MYPTFHWRDDLPFANHGPRTLRSGYAPSYYGARDPSRFGYPEKEIVISGTAAETQGVSQCSRVKISCPLLYADCVREAATTSAAHISFSTWQNYRVLRRLRTTATTTVRS
jgi:hypothetical protein